MRQNKEIRAVGATMKRSAGGLFGGGRYMITAAVVVAATGLFGEEAGDYIHYRLGIKYMRENRLEQAVEEFRKVLAAYPDNYNAYMNLARIRKRQGRPRLVIYNLKKALTYNPGWSKAHKLLAEAYEEDRQYQKAIMELQLYQQACDPAERDSIQARIDGLIAKVTGKEAPTRQEAAAEKPAGRAESSASTSKGAATGRRAAGRSNAAAEKEFRKGVELYGEGEYDAAIQHLRKCLSLQPGHPGAYYYAGLIRRRKGQNDMAKINFSRALDYPELGYNAHFYLGKIHGEDGEYGKAVEHLRAYIAATDYEAGREEARSLIEKYRSAQPSPTAEKPLDIESIGRDALRKEVEKVGPRTEYAPIEVRIDSLLTMVLVDTLTDPGQAMLEGLKRFRTGNYDGAIKEFKKVQVAHPAGDVAAHCVYNIGTCYMKLRLYADAENQYRQLLDRYPSHSLAPRSLFFLALSLLERGESGSAERLFRRFIRSHASHPWRGRAYEKLGDAFMDMENPKKAVDAYLQAASLAAAPTDRVHAEYKLGNGYLEISNPGRALKHFREALSEGEAHGLFVRVPDSYYKIADHLYREKKYDEAFDYYRKATRKYPSFQETPWGIFQIANIHKNAGRYRKAIDTYRELIDQHPEDYWARQAQWKLEDTIWEHEYQAILR